jgi:hypothetical protein
MQRNYGRGQKRRTRTAKMKADQTASGELQISSDRLGWSAETHDNTAETRVKQSNPEAAFILMSRLYC